MLCESKWEGKGIIINSITDPKVDKGNEGIAYTTYDYKLEIVDFPLNLRLSIDDDFAQLIRKNNLPNDECDPLCNLLLKRQFESDTNTSNLISVPFTETKKETVTYTPPNCSQCYCEFETYLDYDSAVMIYSSPNGSIVGSFRFEDDSITDGIGSMILDTSNNGWFRIHHIYSDQKWGKYKGKWIKSEVLEIGTNNYDNSQIDLFERPFTKSGIIGVINKERYLHPTDCYKEWLYVKADSLNKGWLEKKNQCNNPYTNCN